MSSKDGARKRHTAQLKPQSIKKTTKQKYLTEEEAVSKASNKWLSQFAIALILSLATPIVVLFLLPSPVKPKEFPSLSPPLPYEGPLAINDVLASAEKIFEGEVVGPESIVFDGDIMYTGTIDGWVNRLHNGKVTRLVRFGKEPCGGFENENTCGRPLGLRFDKNKRLIVCDAYHGLFRVDVTTGDYETLYASTTSVGGAASKFLNDLDIDNQGRIYFTDSSTEWHRNQFHNILLEGDTSGRLLMYDPKTKETAQLVSGLMFPNGVQLTPDYSGLLVTELCRARILKYDFKSRVLSVWSDSLPGTPDNIRYDETTQTYWVGMALLRYVDKFSLFDHLAGNPLSREISAKILSVSNLPTIKKYLGMLVLPEPQSLAIEFDQNGQIISSLQDKKGQVVKGVSEVHIHKGYIYMGSYGDDFIARLDMRKISKH